MTHILIRFSCEMCGLIHIILIKNNKISFSVLDKLYSFKQIINDNGYLVCIDCKHKNYLNIKKFL